LKNIAVRVGGDISLVQTKVTPNSFSRFFFRPLAKAHTRTATVFIDEFDACILEGAPNNGEGGAPRLRRPCL